MEIVSLNTNIGNIPNIELIYRNGRRDDYIRGIEFSHASCVVMLEKFRWRYVGRSIKDLLYDIETELYGKYHKIIKESYFRNFIERLSDFHYDHLEIRGRGLFYVFRYSRKNKESVDLMNRLSIKYYGSDYIASNYLSAGSGVSSSSLLNDIILYENGVRFELSKDNWYYSHGSISNFKRELYSELKSKMSSLFSDIRVRSLFFDLGIDLSLSHVMLSDKLIVLDYSFSNELSSSVRDELLVRKDSLFK